MSSSNSSTALASSCLQVAGVWSRVWEEDPLGDEEHRDVTTLVLWTQTSLSGIYIDLRLPRASPGRGNDEDATNKTNILFDKDPGAIRASGPLLLPRQLLVNEQNKRELLTNLAKIKSFAGVLKFHPGDITSGMALEKDSVLLECCKNDKAPLPLCTCIWERMIDYQPPSGGLDVGVCASYSQQSADGSMKIRETGQDASYAEGWSRLPFTYQGPFFAMELVSEEIRCNNELNTSHRQHRQGFWVRAGSSFAYAIGRPAATDDFVKQHTGKTLVEFVEEEATSEEETLKVLGQYVGLFGEIQNSKWNILHSTNPRLVGCCLVGTEPMMKSSRTEMCCSMLRTCCTDADTAHVGDSVEQVICGDDDVFVRTWKVVELNGCTIP